jgi:hypothetical protein
MVCFGENVGKYEENQQKPTIIQPYSIKKHLKNTKVTSEITLKISF